MIDYSKFEKSLKHLELQFNNYKTLDKNQPELIQEAVKESVIQRFETCWDCLWKILKRYLINELGLPEVPNSPKPILRLSMENNLLTLPIEEWFKFANSRIGTSHDYNGEKALEALELMETFISASINLVEKLSNKKWS